MQEAQKEKGLIPASIVEASLEEQIDELIGSGTAEINDFELLYNKQTIGRDSTGIMEYNLQYDAETQEPILVRGTIYLSKDANMGFEELGNKLHEQGIYGKCEVILTKGIMDGYHGKRVGG